MGIPRWLHLGWLTRDYWRYVLDDSRADHEYGPFNDVPNWGWWRRMQDWKGDYVRNPLAIAGNWIARAWCRANGHPAGVFFYNIGGDEPDMHCQGCGEDIG